MKKITIVIKFILINKLFFIFYFLRVFVDIDEISLNKPGINLPN
jgi:hypothetical protein